MRTGPIARQDAAAWQGWPTDAAALRQVQEELARTRPDLSVPAVPVLGASAITFVRPPAAADQPEGERAWAGACLRLPAGTPLVQVVAGRVGEPYRPGLLALREGALREAAVRALPRHPDVLIVDATGRDHPRRAGLALHLGAVLGIGTVGVTDRPLIAHGSDPRGLSDTRGALAPLRIAGSVVACWVRTRPGTRPVVVHPGWGVPLDRAVELVLSSANRARTPQPLRIARRAARLARSQAGG